MKNQRRTRIMFRLKVQISALRFGWLYFLFLYLNTLWLIHSLCGYKISQNNNFALLVFANKYLFLPTDLGKLNIHTKQCFSEFVPVYVFIARNKFWEYTFTLCYDPFHNDVHFIKGQLFRTTRASEIIVIGQKFVNVFHTSLITFLCLSSMLFRPCLLSIQC